ncbi:MAG: biotin transporter BioY [Geminicoccaceae bacterium]
MSAPSVNHTLADRLWPATTGQGVLRAVLLAVFGSLLLWASAKVQVPFYPVPMTFQTGVVLLIGLAYGPRLAAGTLLLYLAEGAMGLPVFAGTPERGIGLAYMVGPTGGYLLGFVAAAAIAGWTAERSRHWLTMVLGLFAGIVSIHLLGAAWLATLIGPAKAVSLGVLPFLLGDAVKLALVAVAAEAGLVRRRG